MRLSSLGSVALISICVGLAACGSKIGDECQTSSDCAQDLSRQCDVTVRGGYCTIGGCDYGTCPDEAVCVRFFPGVQNGTACSSVADCGPDEICTLQGWCAPRSIEVRFCMATCGDDGDCRDGYECRDTDIMVQHGGEPVPNPDTPTDVPSTAFCAPRKPCTTNLDCASDGTLCGPSTRTCGGP